jgi:hypothetical protein
VQNVARGTSTYSIGCVFIPAASSTAITPSSEALRANAGPGTRSPIAYTPWAPVRIAPSTSISPFGATLTPAPPSPSASVSAPRRAAITSQLASPACSPYPNVTLESLDRTFRTGVLVWISMPCRFKPRSATFEMSASSVGSTRSSISNSSTSTPRRAYAEAISAPDAPAPTTAIVFGSSGNAQASSVPITRPPNAVPGIGFFTEPVASRIVFALICWGPTLTAPLPASDPSPSISSIPFFLNSPDTPPVSVLITFSQRALTAAKSISGSATLIPNSFAPRTSLSTSATRSTAFAGMQAEFRQRPPTRSFSTTAVFIPSWAARIAATYPPGPEPITTQSYAESGI